LKISDEYLMRHSIHGPFVKHTSRGVLFIREMCDYGVYWTILTTEWNHPGNHPGSYSVKYLCPVHNVRSFEFELSLECTDMRLQWEEYEDFFERFSKSYKKSSIVNEHKEIILMAWEMFAYSHDNYLCKNFKNHYNLLFKSLDFTTCVDSRYKSYLEFMKILGNEEVYFSSFKSDLNKYVNNYSYWLVDLIHKNGC